MKNKKILILLIPIFIIAIALVAFCVLNKPSYTVLFINNDNKEEVKVKKGDMVDIKNVSDSHFIGWYEEDTTEKFDFSTKITRDYNLIAKYEEKYKVTFDTDGGSTIKSVEVYKGEKVNEPINPTKSGMTFIEWQLNGVVYNFESEVSSDITLKAIWKDSNGKYTIVFDTDGGSTIKNASVVFGKTVSKPVNPTKRGYNFVEWQLDNTTYDFTTTVTNDITLKAIWKEKDPVKITFVNDGKTVKTLTIGKGDTIGSVPTVENKDGFIFDGWYNSNTQYTAKSTVNKDITLTAKFISIDQSNLRKMLSNVKSTKITMEKGNDNLTSPIKVIDGCTVEVSKAPSTIERGTKDSTVSVEYEVTCGEEKGKQKINVTVKASPYKYTKVANSNMLNYDVNIENGSWNGDAKLFLGNEGSFKVVSRKAVVENAKIESNPTFKMRFDNDSSTLYTVTFRR